MSTAELIRNYKELGYRVHKKKGKQALMIKDLTDKPGMVIVQVIKDGKTVGTHTMAKEKLNA